MSDDTDRFDLGQADSAGSVLSQSELVHEIRASFALVQPYDTQVATWFYEHFLTNNPRYRKYFSNDPAVIERRLFQAVERIVADLDRLDVFLPYLRRLALRHRKFGLRPAHYQAFGVSLLATLRHFAGPQWTERMEDAWQTGYGLVASVMLTALEEAEQSTPPYWDAEVIGHEPLAAGIAQITFRLRQDRDRPAQYAFRAGQYAAIETAGLVRTWRDFSFSGVPKAADEVEFQIQAGRPGGVSDILVNATAVGDRVRIAAAEGELAFAGPARALRLLAVAHGTGAAPIHALVQSMAAAGDLRELTVLLVTEGEPHYLAGPFEQLSAEHPGLTVEHLVGDPAAAVRAHALAVEGARGAVLVGPSPLVESCRTALLRGGVEAGDISSDLFG